ncbi:unnamed protein product [Paramecium sonneborni]|uniref:P-loop containing nucleoside triphosphate hydrolase n=1 Tax=Paramecium sonneborni TaxID=65129 RepID=A0A8S1LHK8_9CILI|nr:unnamed protein product [Paramecium sonneborni]
MNSKRPSQERVSNQYNQSLYPLNPIVNSNIDYSKISGLNSKNTTQNEELKMTNRYLQTQLTLYQEKVVALEKKISELTNQTEYLQNELNNYQFELEQVYVNTQKQFSQQEISKEEIEGKEENINSLQVQVQILQEKITTMHNTYQQERLQMKQLLLNKELDNKLLYSELNKLQIKNGQKNLAEDGNQLKAIIAEYNEFKIKKLKEIEQLQDQINNYQDKLKQLDQIKIEEIQSKYHQLVQDYEQQQKLESQLNQQILQLQSQLSILSHQCQTVKEEKNQWNKEKQAIETYYLDQLQKQDNQINLMIRTNQISDSKVIIQKLQSQIEQKDKLIKEISQQKCNCSQSVQYHKELEQKNTTLILEVERLNSILKSKLLELENIEKEKKFQMDKQFKYKRFKNEYNLLLFPDSIYKCYQQLKNRKNLEMLQSEWELSIAIIGDSGVGKSTFLQMFLTGQFVLRHNDKITINHKEIMLGQKTVQLKLIDISGKEPFRSMAWVHYRTCIGIILIFDLSSRDSYENLKKWYEEIQQYVDQEKIIIRLVGNKCDKLFYNDVDQGKEGANDRHYIQFEEGEQFAATHQMQYSQTSSSVISLAQDENYQSIPQIFAKFSEEILEFIKKNQENGKIEELMGIRSLKKQVVVHEVKKKINRSSCC